MFVGSFADENGGAYASSSSVKSSAVRLFLIACANISHLLSTPSNPTSCAPKILPVTFSNKTFMLDSVNQEYELLRKLHENNADNPIVHSIPEYYSKFEMVVEGVNCLCVVMEYIQGKTLKKMYNLSLIHI